MTWVLFCLTGSAGVAVGFLLAQLWKRKHSKQLIPTGAQPHLEFDLLMKLLDRRDEWEPDSEDYLKAHTLRHNSGLRLWIENRPYSDMWLYELGDSEECKAMFSGAERDQLRAKADLVMRDWKWSHGKPLTAGEQMLLQVRNWKTEDPEWQELQQVI